MICFVCRWYCIKSLIILHVVDRNHTLYEKCICIFKHNFEFWYLHTKRTVLKLEMKQNVWQSIHKSLVYPLKSETAIKLKLKKKFTISAFLLFYYWKLAVVIHFCHFSVFNLLGLVNGFWSKQKKSKQMYIKLQQAFQISNHTSVFCRKGKSYLFSFPLLLLAWVIHNLSNLHLFSVLLFCTWLLIFTLYPRVRLLPCLKIYRKKIPLEGQWIKLSRAQQCFKTVNPIFGSISGSLVFILELWLQCR